jgi:hypothetical protein
MTLRTEMNKRLITPGVAINAAIAKFESEGKTPAELKSNFSVVVLQLERDAYSIYKTSQKSAFKDGFREFAKEKTKGKATKDETIDALSEESDELNAAFLSLSQSRKSRAGSSFETIIRTLFKKLSYPFAEQQVINGKPDFLLPSREHYETNPMDCIIFTAKRTLRERWRQIVTEGTRGLGFFLATIDDKVTEQQLKEMHQHRIYLVVPKTLKDDKAAYRAAPNVISFEGFFEDHLDPAITRWKKNGVIQ